MAKEQDHHENESSQKKKRRRKHGELDQTLMWHQVPEARAHYEISYMHRDVVTRIVYAHAHGYVLTASNDGVVKFWKRVTHREGVPATPINKKDIVPNKGLEFIKSYTAHTRSVLCLILDHAQDTGASIGKDNAIQLYDVSTFDVKTRIDCKNLNLGYHAAFCSREQSLLAVSSRKIANHSDGCAIYLFNILKASSIPIQIITLHAAPITTLEYSFVNNCAISTDLKGTIEIWDCTIQYTNNQNINDAHHHDHDAEPQIKVGHAPSEQNNYISWTNKMSTSLYDFMKRKAIPISLAIAPNGYTFCIMGNDAKLCVFNYKTGKLKATYDETDEMYRDLIQKNPSANETYAMDMMEYGKRAATEREISESATVFSGGVTLAHQDQDDLHQVLKMMYDDSSQLLLYPTLVGIKVLHLPLHKCARILGKADASALRFLGLCLCSGQAKRDTQLDLARTGGSSAAMQHQALPEVDPLLLAYSYQKRRIYVFSNRDPVEDLPDNDEESIQRAYTDRNVMNEPPDAQDLQHELQPKARAQDETLGREAILRTSMGDIHFKLFANLCPRTVENFCTHARQGYYDNVVFHRVIKGFMIQTGDPLGDGTGGESIWGGEFEDEFNRE